MWKYMMRRKDLLKCTREFYKLLPAIILLTCSLLVKAQTYETGFITVNQPNRSTWFKATFKNTYNSQPIVIAGPLTDFSVPTVGVRIRHVTPNGFEYQLEETEYNDGVHGEETFAYLAIEQGVHAIGDQVWEAGSILGDVNSTAFQSVSLTGNFSDAPIVLTQLASNEDPIAGITRVRDVTATNFAVKVDEEQREDRRRAAADSIHYLAIQRGGGIIGSKAYAAGVALEMDHTSKTITFPDSFSQPIFLAGAQTVEGNDPYFLRYNKLHNEGINVRLHEERSGDNEISHPQEEVGYLVLEANEPLNKRLLWYENFGGELANGTTTDEGATRWSVNSTTNNRTSRQAYRLESRGDEAIWTSEVIPISGYSNVKISAQLSSNGTLELDDHLELYYRLNDGPETPLLNGLWIGGIGASTMAMAGGLNGNSVQIIAKFKSNANDEAYYIDDICIFTESNDRYAIQGGDWDDSDTWSYTPNGPSCSCIPDQLSNTYINNKTVDIDQHSHTRNLTVSNNGILQWTANTKGLMLWGNATLEVQSSSQLNRNTDPFAYVKFVQWNDREVENDQERVGLSYPEIDVVIDIGSSASVEASALRFNAAGTYTIRGDGGIALNLDFDINHQAEVVNQLTGLFLIKDDTHLNYPGIVFTNNGNIDVGDDLVLDQGDCHLINNRDFNTNSIALRSAAISGSQLTTGNSSLFLVKDLTNLNNNELIIHNNATIKMDGDIIGVAENKGIFHNHTGGVWSFGGDIDSNTHLFAHEPENEIIYNSTEFQKLYSARDINSPSQPGPYWHLTLSNQNIDEANPKYSYKRFSFSSPNLNINGDFTIIGTPSGRVDLSAHPNKNLFVRGHWERQGLDYTTFGKGNANETITFDGTESQDLRNKESFLNLTINKNTGELTIADTISVKKKVNFQNGIVEVGTLPFMLSSTASIASVSDNSHVRGKVNKRFYFENLASSANYTIDIYAAGKSNTETMVLYLDGNLKQTWTNVGGNADNRTFEKYTFTTSDKFGRLEVKLTNDAGSSQDLRIDRIELNGASFEAENAEAFTDEREFCNSGGHEWIYCNGGFGWNFSLVEDYTKFTFPVGNGTYYRPATISGLTESSDFAVEYFAANPDDNGYAINNTAPDVSKVSDCEYWEISRENGTAAANLTLTWGDNSCPVDLNSLTIVRWDGSKWAAIPSTIDAANQSITSTAPLTELGIFTLTTANNTPPLAVNDTVTIPPGTAIAINVPANDSDTDGLNLSSVNITELPQHGSVAIDPTTGVITYTPDENFMGKDSLLYTIEDTKGALSNQAKVLILVTPSNTAPLANLDKYLTNEDTILEQNVSANDSDADSNALSFVVDPAGLPIHGSVVLNPDGTFTYTPAENYFGDDQFIYQVCDDGNPSLCDTAKVSISITPVNDAPTALADTFTIAENEFLQENLLTNDYDVDGDSLINATVVTLPQNGTVDVKADGRFTYQPFNNYTGEDTFSYQVCDNQNPALCTEATVTVRIRAGLLSIPKGFSPNGDNSYDEWIISGIRGYADNTVTIFNRWGSVVFKAGRYDNTEVVWDGNSSGSGLITGGPQLPDGVYFYVIDLGESYPPLSGFLVLKR